MRRIEVQQNIRSAQEQPFTQRYDSDKQEAERSAVCEFYGVFDFMRGDAPRQTHPFTTSHARCAFEFFLRRESRCFAQK